MGIFTGIGEAQVGMGNVYFLHGIYKVEVLEVKLLRSRKREDLYIVEVLILESDNPERKPGMKASWVVNLKQDAALGNIKGFLGSALGVDPYDAEALKEAFLENGKDTTEAVAEQSVSADNPLKGTALKLTCINKKTKAGMDFTVHTWEPVDN
jgi:hypothetical protein